MMKLLRSIFTWWHNSTIGTSLYTWRRGAFIGKDAQGNVYYQDKDGYSINGKPRRWVIYNGDIEASRIPPEWHGWLHYTVDEPPAGDVKKHEWQKPHQINLTGTCGAHKPRHAQKARGYMDGYEAWEGDIGKRL